MALFLKIHPKNPQKRLIEQAVAILKSDGVAVYPTDTAYGLGCTLTNRRGVERIIQIRRLPASHRFSILCPNLSDISRYGRMDTGTYRLLKRFLPGPYTFVLGATREVPKNILPRRKTIGVRIPGNPICLDLLEAMGEPLISTTVRLPDEEEILSDPFEIQDRLGGVVDLVIDGDVLYSDPSTVVDLSEGTPVILREGAGDSSVFF